MNKNFEERILRAVWVFDLVDAVARDQRRNGSHPRPIEPIRFYLTGQASGQGRLPQELKPPWELVMTRNPSGFHLFYDAVKLPNGNIRQVALPDGTYDIRVEGRGYLPQTVTAPLPFHPQPTPLNPYQPIRVELDPDYLYPFSGYGPTVFKGYVQDGNNKPIKDVEVSATVTVKEGDQQTQKAVTFKSDAAGQWVLILPNGAIFPPNQSILLQFTLPNENAPVKSLSLIFFQKRGVTYLGRVELS